METDLRDQLQRALGDHYTIERELGGGGMSRVFLAEEVSLGRKVVVKVLPPDLAAGVNTERFRREIQLAARLQHPHIVPIYAAAVTDGLLYYTMPYVEGESLRARLSRSGELPIADAAGILRDILGALSYAHEHGVVHRDIKPDNILLTGPHALVADFGVAKALKASTTDSATPITSLGVALGTPAYMSPEQATADPATDHRADLYSVGAVAYEMLTGQQIFSARSPQAMLAAQAVESPEPLEKRRPSVPPQLSSVVMRALDKHAADRYQSAGEMLAAVNAAVTPGATTTPYPGVVSPRAANRADRGGTVKAVAAAIVLLALTSSSWYWYGHRVPSAGAEASDAIPSLAVLPFENLGKQEDNYFVEGMTEEISSRLGQLSGVRVIGRQSSRAYANTTKGIPQIGKELGVGYILTGSVRWDRSLPGKNRVRVSPTLVRTSDGSQMWSEPYEDQLTGVFQMQSSVAERVAGALRLQLGPAQHATLTKRPTSNLDAYDYYLRGRALRTLNMDDARNAPRMFERATQLDPRFALAFAYLGRARTRELGLFGFTAEVIHQAKAAIDSALALEPDLAPAHVALAYYYYRVTEDHARGLDEFRKAEELAPSEPSDLEIKAEIERSEGKFVEAVSDLQKAAALDPRDLHTLANLSQGLGYLGRYDEADTVARQMLAIDPTIWNGYFLLARDALNRSGDIQGSLAIMKEGVARTNPAKIGTYLSYATWPAFLDPAIARALRTASPGPSDAEKLEYYNQIGNMSYTLRDAAGKREAADSILAIAQRVYHGVRYRDEATFYTSFAYSLKGDRKRAMDAAEAYLRSERSSKDAVQHIDALISVVFAGAMVGEHDRAIEALSEVLSGPTPSSGANLRTDPELESLRSDPRFQLLTGSKAPIRK
ncbi:MAG: protein kinase domain-containing protein [Gemmatimonadaceae bacterium]